MCKCNHRHSPSKRAGSWKAVKEFWDYSYKKKKDLRCADCEELLKIPKSYYITTYVSSFLCPILICAITHIILLNEKTFSDVGIMALCIFLVSCISAILFFRLLPALALSFGKWELVPSLESDYASRKSQKMETEYSVKFVMYIFGIVIGVLILIA